MATTSDVPLPLTVSDEARAILERAAQAPPMPDPAPDDEGGWRKLGAIAATTDPSTAMALAMATTGAVPAGIVEPARPASTDGAAYFITDSPVTDIHDRTLFAIHGGGFTFGGGESARVSTGLLAANYGVRTWGMDYRQLPDHPYPAGLDDCLTVYRHLLATTDPSRVAILGQSGGGNLAAAVLLRAHDEGLPMPAAAALLSPAVDLTRSGDSYRTNGFTLDGQDLGNVFARYADGRDLRHPHLSPLFGDLGHFPPTIVTAGTRDFLLSDAVRLHRKLVKGGVRSELHVWEGAPHGLFMGRAPEDREQVEQVRTFLESAWSAARSTRG